MSEREPLLGHDDVLNSLAGLIQRGRLHHALLLEGPAGVGKTAVAEWLVRTGICEQSAPGGCGSCRSCALADRSHHPDVIRVVPDAKRASATIPVAAIREVVRQAGFHRYGAARRFVLIEPAEAMQPAAGNALLKTLEEPPAGTHFVLIATHARRLLPTIVSRCQRIRLRPVPTSELANWLEGRGVPDALAVAQLAQGCVGRALSTTTDSLEARGVLRTGLLEVLGGDLATIFDYASQMTKGQRAAWRSEVSSLFDLMEELLRDVVSLASQPDAPLLHPGEAPRLQRWREVLWPEGVTRLQGSLDEARANLQANVTGRTVLEALLTRWATELGPARVMTVSDTMA